LKGIFQVYAKADRPWNPHWPSPLSFFLGGKHKPGYLKLNYMTPNLIHSLTISPFHSVVQALSEMQWGVAVITHDPMDLDDLHAAMRRGPQLHPLIPRLPNSMYGRVFDIRAVDDGARDILNKKILPRFGTHLPECGTAVLLASWRRRGIEKSHLSFSRDMPFSKGGDVRELASVLTDMFNEQVMAIDPSDVRDINQHWTLLTEEERAKKNAEDLRASRAEVEDLKTQVNDLKTSVTLFEQERDTMRGLLDEALDREREAKEHHTKLLKDVQQLQERLDGDRAAREAQRLSEALQEAQEGAELAEDLLDEQHRELLAARRENLSLRRELARLGSSVLMETKTEEFTPDTWDELLSAADRLKSIRLGRVEDGIGKLRGQDQERTWVRRTWESLLALDEYAGMKDKRGAGEVPHFAAYLQDPEAEHVIPRMRYSAVESKGVMMNTKFRTARVFPVPLEVDPSGTVLMEAHIRIGSGKPPAPRMHFHDDTSGETGLIYIGHIGPHLPNYQTN
jgi:predicted  nucleic acid-binding Zn-ribbon protein